MAASAGHDLQETFRQPRKANLQYVSLSADRNRSFPRLARSRRSNVMSRWIATLAVLIAAAAAGLPAGWCCRPVSAEVTATKKAPAHNCCGKKTAESPGTPVPRLSCCCSPTVSTLPKSVSVASPFTGESTALVVPAGYLQAEVCREGVLAVDQSPPAGPPLNLLQCVWRC